LILAASLVGCRSGVERDVVQRELRQQEDQIYALEDYLQEYQQLLCDARAENAALKRQLVQGQFRDGGPSSATDDAGTLPSPPPTTAPTPPIDTTQPATEPAPAPEVPPLDLSTPDVPPLESSSAHEPEQIADHAVEQASAELAVTDEEAEVAKAEIVDAPPTAVVLRGQVQLASIDDAADITGPRVLLNIEPVNAEGQQVACNGKLSVLVLDPAAPEKSRQLARWDFQPAELADMACDAADSAGYELPLQLPAESPRNRPLELWVRLLPEDSEKLLGRTTMDLSRSGRFASANLDPAKRAKRPPRHIADVASAELDLEIADRPRVNILDTNVEQSGWQTAKPGEVAVRPSFGRAAAGDWKLATRPIPESQPAPIAESRPIAASAREAADADRYQRADAPTWSPDRSDSGTVNSPPVDHTVPPPGPSWAPNRFTR